MRADEIRWALVAEDDYCVREYLKDLLERAGFSVVTAEDGIKALERVRSWSADRLQLLVTDIVMPEQEGITLMRKMRQRFPRVKIVAISGGGRFGSVDVYLEAAGSLGADQVLAKPFTTQKFMQTVADLTSGEF